MIESLNTSVTVITVGSSRGPINIATITELKSEVVGFVRSYIYFAYISHNTCLVAGIHGDVGILLFFILDKDFG